MSLMSNPMLAPRPTNPFTDMPVTGVPATPTATPNQPNPLMGMLGPAKGGGATASPAIPLTPDGQSQTTASGLGAQPQPNATRPPNPFTDMPVEGGPAIPTTTPNQPNPLMGMLGSAKGGGATAVPTATAGQPQPTSGGLGGGKGGGAAAAQPQLPMAEGLNVNPPQQLQPQQGQYAPLAPQGQFNVNQASAGALQQAMQGAQAGMGFQAQNVQPTGYQAQAAGATGYNPSAMQAQGYGAAQTGATGFNAADVGSQGYRASGPRSTSYDAATTGRGPRVGAENVQAGQLAGSDLGAYTNPYEDQVVQQTLSDISGAQEKSLNQMGAQATAAKAFGGSRQGIAEAETRKGFAEQAAQAVSGLRQAGFTQAQQMAQQDIGTAQQAALANQQANLQAGTTTAGFKQQSNLSNQAAQNQAAQFGAGAQNIAYQQAAAAKNQAAQFGAGAANQAASQTAAQQQAASQFGASASNQAAMQNAAALNQAAQFGSGAANQAAAANMAAQNQAAQFGSSAANQMALANQGAFNQASQFGATQGMSAQLANQQAQMQANNARMAAASQLGGLGQQAFNTGQTIQGNQQQQGLLQQGIQQALIDAAKGQYGGYTGAPTTALQAPLAALGVTPTPQTTTNSMQPGLFNYLQLGAGMIPK